ncbi:enoyl-CoA hydratase/isomerase family protein [Arsenicicoccus sp. oral taxon 190]|uniref:enoyl-CoA hydratase/isomerase family protein n=1 Tax=Arsenicicoccus sp. oral taxon 190 TaxID=1658671 RepID=UPI000679ED17|nr:enoyl-CoA hydratase/isomerase family protein [Arsenicicoccus sp. oral taxon 190]AKT51965.1 enoyl-CoA hydratase [Arsenicicoccus sp. oral taxon 190]
MTQHPHLHVTADGPVLTVTLANPDERNAQTPSLWRALAAVGEAVGGDIRVVVLRAEGASFSAGLHRGMLSPAGMPDEPHLVATASREPDATAELIAGFQRAFRVWQELPQVVVAAVQGHAIGAGFQLALAADLRVCADDVQLAMRETSLGLVPDLAGTKPLVSCVGYARALEICATGRFVGASEAHAIGLATVVVPRDELDETTGDLVQALLDTPAGALRELKPLLRSATESPPGDQLRHEREAQVRRLAALARGDG